GILSELSESPGLSASLDTLYQHLLGFRTCLEGTSQQDKYNTHRQQLDVLEHFSHVVEATREFSAASSALVRLAQYGEEVLKSEGFQSLQALLNYDGKLATIDFRVRMGADGRVR